MQSDPVVPAVESGRGTKWQVLRGSASLQERLAVRLAGTAGTVALLVVTVGAGRKWS